MLSIKRSELSIRNYINKYKKDHPGKNITKVESQIQAIVDNFKNSFPMPLRHKIAAHIDESFQHTDFTSAYIMPALISKYVEMTAELKDVFFGFCNYSKQDRPFHKIKKQSDEILKAIK